MLPIANIFQPLIDALESVMLFFHDNIGFGWGFSIIFLTIVVRAALIPLTFKQIRSMQAMQRVAPQLKELQAKYKDDKQRLQQETMKFYQENKINPFASCLPLVLQMPVFISLFYMLRKDLRHDICPDINPAHLANPKPCGETDEASFLFIPDLTNKATGSVLIALIVLYVGSQLLSTILMSTATDRTQRFIFLALPFFFVVFVINFPAGLLVYWITTNFWTIIQQTIVRKRLGPMRPPSDDAPMSIMDRLLHGRGSPQPAPATSGSNSGSSSSPSPAPKSRPSSPPPPSPRKKKKRSGRRR